MELSGHKKGILIDLELLTIDIMELNNFWHFMMFMEIVLPDK